MRDSLSKGWRWAIWLFLLMTANVASAASFYVSTTGSDTNSGSSSAPFRTIRKAASVVTAGSTVFVRPGVYQERVVTSKNGTASQRIRYVSAQKWKAKIIPPSRRKGDDTIWTNSGHYVDIEGFEIDGLTNTYFRTGLYNDGHNVRIYKNHVHHIIGTSPNAVGCCGGSGINSSGPTYDTVVPVEIFQNVVHDIGDQDYKYRKEFSSAHAYYIANPGANVYNNIGYRSENSNYVLSHNPQANIVSNNIAFGDAVCGFYVSGQGGYIARNNIFQNNISIGNGQAYCQGGSTDTTNLFINNIAWNNGDVDYFPGNQRGLINRDPKLVNYRIDGTGDYHLTAASPGIDQGRWTMAPRTDFDGTVRPQGAGIDIGPYEYAKNRLFIQE